MPKGRRVIAMIPPVKGVHKGMPANATPDLTAPDTSNVIGVSALKGKRTIAKRDGTVVAFTNAAGGGGGSRVTGLATALRASGALPEAQNAGAYVPFVDVFAAYAYPFNPNFGAFRNTADLKGDWIRYSKRSIDHAPNKYQGGTTLPGEWIGAVRGAGFPDHLQIRTAFGSSFDNHGVLRGWDGANDLTIVQNCIPAAGAVDAVHCTNVGPIIRAHAAGGHYVWAYLARQSENVVRLRVEGVRGVNTQTIAESADITLSGTQALVSDCQIRLDATSAAVRATLTWPSVLGTSTVVAGDTSSFGVTTTWVAFTGAAGTFQAEKVTQATSGAEGYILQRVQSGAAGFLQVYTTTAAAFDASNTLTGATSGATATASGVSTVKNQRQGVNFRNPGTSVPPAESGYYYRRITRVSGADRKQPEPEVIAEMLGGYQVQGGRYQIPPNFDCFYIKGDAPLVYRLQASTAGYTSNTRPSVPSVDTMNDYVLDGDASPSSTASRFKRTSLATIEVWDTSPPTESLACRAKLRDVLSTEDDGVGFAFMLGNLHP